MKKLWRCRGSNPVPLACKASALPFELHPLMQLADSLYLYILILINCNPAKNKTSELPYKSHLHSLFI